MKKGLLFSLLILLSAGLMLNACKKEEEEEPELSDLDIAKKEYQDNYIGTKLSTIGWTGVETGCNSGSISVATQNKVVQRVNYYRALCGLPAVTLNSSQNKSCQDAALIMMANNKLTHYPTTGMSCYTQDGYDAANSGNIAIGWGSSEPDANHSVNAVSGYMEDPGSGNEIVGHRAWLLSRILTAIGTGSVYNEDHTYNAPNGNTYKKGAANCIRWGENLNGSETTGPEFISFPPAAYVPSNLVFPRWHFSVPDASFANATVTVAANGTNYTCNVIARETQSPGLDSRIVWEPQGINITADMNFTVTVSGILGVAKTSYTYTVKAFKVNETARKAVGAQGKMLIL